MEQKHELALGSYQENKQNLGVGVYQRSCWPFSPCLSSRCLAKVKSRTSYGDKSHFLIPFLHKANKHISRHVKQYMCIILFRKTSPQTQRFCPGRCWSYTNISRAWWNTVKINSPPPSQQSAAPLGFSLSDQRQLSPQRGRGWEEKRRSRSHHTNCHIFFFFFLSRLKSGEKMPPLAHQGAVTGDGAWPFNAAIACQRSASRNCPSEPRLGSLSSHLEWEADSGWAIAIIVVIMCQEGWRAPTHSPSPKICHVQQPSARGTLEQKTRLMPVQEGTPTQEIEPGRADTVSLFHFSPSVNSPIIWAPTAFLEGANRRGEGRGEERLVNFKASTHFSGFVCVYFSTVRANGSRSLRYRVMSLPGCFRAWQEGGGGKK